MILDVCMLCILVYISQMKYWKIKNESTNSVYSVTVENIFNNSHDLSYYESSVEETFNFE